MKNPRAKQKVGTRNKSSQIAINVIVFAVFALLLVVTLRFGELQQKIKIEATLKAEGTQLATGAAESLRISVENLRAVASLLSAFEDVDFRSFSRFASRYLEDDSGLLILEWQPVISGAQRDRFVEKARQGFRPDFELSEPDAQGKPIPAAERMNHVPVYYMLSKHETTDTTGLDLAWSDERMISKWDARDSGQPRSSGFFPVVTGADTGFEPAGVAITLPIYSGGVTPEERWRRPQNLVGYLAGVYDLTAMIDARVDDLVARGFSVAITDGTASGVGVFRKAGTATEHTWVTPMEMFGQDWHLSLTATERLLAEQRDPLWSLLPMMTLIVGLGVLAFLQVLQRKNIDLELAHGRLELALEQVKESESHLRELSRHDSLTRLYNRRALIERLGRELELGTRHNFVSTLLMLDLDHFKQINDTWGHPAGDEILRRFAELCQSCARTTDMVARLGGEEFAILLPHTDADAALVIAERLRQSTEQTALDIESNPDPVNVTVSIGLAVSYSGVGVDELIARADKALYLAKQSGRNTIKMYQ
jgi:diguanylate cyclase (GGDEF)-like protein